MSLCAKLQAASLLTVLLFGAPSVRAQSAPEQIEFFEKRIRPLFANNCYSCHSREAKKLKGELYLDSRAGVRKGGESGSVIVPGKPDESLLIKAVRYLDKDLRMPPTKKLSADEIADLVAWVKMGAPDPRDDKVVEKSKPATIDLVKGREHWSFRPIRDPAPPAVKDVAWPITAIDRFILAKLEQKELHPAGSADRRTLIRRATFDLTGLPPRPEDVDAFLRDDSPTAFAKVVDRLLASPAYGERWGRHWLDVVRYADTAGDNSDFPIPQMYRYRTWVIDAFNRDMPYDRFVREQLAGDLMPSTSEEDRRQKIVATGYLANSRRHGSYEDKRYPWHLTIEDTIDNFGKTFLGVTMGCARCHDHKFDPFPTEDYYALYGFFSSTRYPWPGIELEQRQHDLVPLVSADVVTIATREREQKSTELATNVKLLETQKAELEKLLKHSGPDATQDVAAVKKKTEETSKRLAAARKQRDNLLKQPVPYETAYAVVDGPTEPKKRIGQIGNARVHIKGEPERPGKEVPRRFPVVLGGQTLPADAKGSGRLDLAKWIVDPQNPLTARVMVNRIWQGHFGRGLVATPNDFGKQGRPPTHPELLDYLAKHFIASGWSIKQMHRTIMLSRVYQLSSSPVPPAEGRDARQIDPDNEYLSHFSRHRLDAESIRDAILAVSGGLERSRGGPHPFPEPTTWDFTQHKPFKAVYETNRRSVYLMTQRIQRHPFLALFDGSDTNASTATRLTSTTPLQALFLMNDPFVHEQARKFAARLLKEGDGFVSIERAFLLAFGRPPTTEEHGQAQTFYIDVNEALRSRGVPDGERSRLTWESFARSLFMSSEFIYVN